MLTDRQVRNAANSGKTKLFDGGGLFLAVDSLSWRYKYRISGIEKLISFGQYPDVKLVDARAQHQAARKLVAAGIDPSAQRRAEKLAQKQAGTTSFAALADLWFKWWQTKSQSAHNVGVTQSRMQNYVLPALGAKDARELRRAEVVAFVQRIETENGRETAKRCLMIVRQILNHAADNGSIASNVVAGVRPSAVFKGADRVENYARVHEKELPALLQSIETYSGTAQTRLAMKLMALTALRTGELIGLRWSEIDFTAKEIRLPAERMKGKRPHVVPLSQQAFDVLSLLRKLNGEHPSGFVFPGARSSKEHIDNNTILAALRRMGFRGKMTGHGFRGVASTILHESGQFAHEVIETALAHQFRSAVAAAYDKAQYLAERRAMLQWLADRYDELLRQAGAAAAGAGA